MDEKTSHDSAAPTPAVSDEVTRDAVEASGQLSEAEADAEKNDEASD